MTLTNAFMDEGDPGLNVFFGDRDHDFPRTDDKTGTAGIGSS